MVNVPNPMIDPFLIDLPPNDELIKVVVVGMIFMGFFIGWLGRKLQTLKEKSDSLGRYGR